ncbi:hypothetical protein RRG08_051598 [Elysia crispata]|uniref:Uncharacterized protein n=1 Tax=Elysia crispata TaxID=231223 RepID=A0AAE1DRY9_9GAST|nr:hypothetical protein RRG08_051598 [Elysia crispata]
MFFTIVILRHMLKCDLRRQQPYRGSNQAENEREISRHDTNGMGVIKMSKKSTTLNYFFKFSSQTFQNATFLRVQRVGTQRHRRAQTDTSGDPGPRRKILSLNTHWIRKESVVEYDHEIIQSEHNGQTRTEHK